MAEGELPQRSTETCVGLFITLEGWLLPAALWCSRSSCVTLWSLHWVVRSMMPLPCVAVVGMQATPANACLCTCMGLLVQAA